MSAAENKAVFLSYASQDAEAARRIAEALRAVGVEVWFDQSELRGGDSWDAKIRQQIKECALFVPVISANTNARAEGYFRLEWKLAVDRSHLMADDQPFLFPIVVGDVTDAAARVPDKFRDVQWTRLRFDETPGELAARLVKLLAGDAGRGHRTPPSGRRENASAGYGDPAPQKKKSLPAWWWLIFPVCGMVLTLVIVLKEPRRGPRPERPGPRNPGAQGSDDRPERGGPNAQGSDARQLAFRARAMSLDKYNSTADDYATAEGLIKRALELDANDGAIWAISSLFNTGIRTRGFDHNPARREVARSHAERAIKLAPRSVAGHFALGRWQRDNDPDPTVAEKTFKKVLAIEPDHPGALHSLATHYHRTGRFEESIAMFERFARVPAQLPLARYGEFLAYFGRSYFAEAERCIRESVAAEPSANSVAGLAMLLVTARGDAAGAVQALAAIPAANRNEHRVVWMSAFAQIVARQPDAALRTLERLSADFIQDNWFVGPKAYWIGRAHSLAGRQEAARIAFESGLAVTTARLKEAADDTALRVTHAEILAWLGRTDEALREERTLAELDRSPRLWVWNRARIFAVLGRTDEAMPQLTALVKTKVVQDWGWPLTPALLRIDPLWDKLRGDVRFQNLLTDSEAARLREPEAKK